VFVRDGKLVVGGKDFEATAHRLAISPDGKRLDLRGGEGDPVQLVYRPKGQTAVHRWAGQRVVFSPTEGTLVLEGGTLVVEGLAGATEVKVRGK
jgi:hypothetical protein